MSPIHEKLVSFSRVIALLFNRATMYQSSHPYVQQTIEDFHSGIQEILKNTSPLVFIMNQDRFFVDDEPLNPGANVSRIVSHFNKVGIQSVSFENGLNRNEISTFLDVFTATDAYPSADLMQRALGIRGVRHIAINQVVFKKVSKNEEIISRDAFRDLTPRLEEKGVQSKKLLVDAVLRHLLAEDFREGITVENLLKDPAALSRKMTENEIAGAGGLEVESGQAGNVLMYQLETLGMELENELEAQKHADPLELAQALMELKKGLISGIGDERLLDTGHSDEGTILDKVNEITDGVLVRIVRDEYQTGKTSVERLAQIIRRLLPETPELKRLMPRIRSVLLSEGMDLPAYLQLVREIGKELRSEDLAGILLESSEQIGVDGGVLISEIKSNPVRTAELLYLASEIRKSSGDERSLSELLVEYVERLVPGVSTGETGEGEIGEGEGDQHMRRVLASIDSSIVGRLRGMKLNSDLMERLERRFNERIEEIIDKVKHEWISSCRDHADSAPKEKDLTVMELIEQSMVDGDELGEIFEIIRGKVRANEIDDNNFPQIYAEITKQQARIAREIKETLPAGTLEFPILTLFIQKEIARARRYGAPFSVVSFSLVKAVVKSAFHVEKVSYSRYIGAVYRAIMGYVRESDLIGELGKNKVAVILPMTSGDKAQIVLRRILKQLHAAPLDVDGTPLEIRLAGVATAYDMIRTQDAASFVDVMKNELSQMERRIKNLQTYF